jgi:cytochrome d ubiquinol oxidase subunit II
MVELWFGIVAVMLAVYVVLDGFDLGAGALHLILARDDGERRQVLAAIGPFWDGNEVWLLASGGALLVAFPKVLASGLSGFYLAIFLVLWALLARGISIEFRSHVRSPLWRAFWDAAFSGSSALLCILLGAALGNILRGLPLGPDGWFSLPLFTDFTARMPVGILDWYTLLVAVFTATALAAHGATFLSWKTGGPVRDRARLLARRLLLAVAAGWPVVTIATRSVDPAFFAGFVGRPLAWLSGLLALGGLVAANIAVRRGRELAAFLGSCAFLAGVLAATAAGMFPVLLRDPAGVASITAYAAANEAGSLRVALSWFLVGMPLAIAYTTIVFRMHRGKAVAAADGEGY